MMTEAFAFAFALAHIHQHHRTCTAAPSVLCSGHLNHYTEPIHNLGTDNDEYKRLRQRRPIYSIDIKIRRRDFCLLYRIYLHLSPFLSLHSYRLMYCVFLRFIYIEKWFALSLYNTVCRRVFLFVYVVERKKSAVQFVLFLGFLSLFFWTIIMIYERRVFSSSIEIHRKSAICCHFRYIWFLVKCIRSFCAHLVAFQIIFAIQMEFNRSTSSGHHPK